jgi:twitching motility protein PilT
MLSITEILNLMPDLKASDLFITANKNPMFKINSNIEISENIGAITENKICDFRSSLLSEEQKKTYLNHGNVDAPYTTDKGFRFRINFFMSNSRSELVARRLPFWNLKFNELNIPLGVEKYCNFSSGLILVCGAAGSGKTTTLSAMLDYINENYKYHISTIEDPIEYVHNDKKSLISQREIGTDVSDFTTALNNVLRISPNVIIVGEIRNIESIEAAISAAMSGHLVISSMYTGNTIQCLQRLSSSFSRPGTNRILLDLSLCLRGIISQRLVLKQDKSESIPAFEMLNVTPSISKYIATEAISDIEEVMRAESEEGSITFDRYLAEMKNSGSITFEEGYKAATNKDEYSLIVSGMETGVKNIKEKDATTNPFDRKIGIKVLLEAAVFNKASDLIITVGSRPAIRINGTMQYLGVGVLDFQDTKRLFFSILSSSQRAFFEENREIDLSLSVKIDFAQKSGDLYRFRVNGFFQKGNIAVAIRLIPKDIPDPHSLRLPSALLGVINKPSGLILITGPTGHGKSTTIASLIDLINRTRSAHIISIEDPIEYVHVNKKSIVEQREVFSDTNCYASGLKYVLRQNPDIIMIGEMRDRETIATALTAAETGHLVLSTLHTGSSYLSVDRIIDSFPNDQQNQIRTQLAGTLLCVTCQRLIPTTEKKIRVAAFEVLLVTSAIKALIRESKIHMIPTAMETGAKDGMITMDRALTDLYGEGIVSKESIDNILTTGIDFSGKNGAKR